MGSVSKGLALVIVLVLVLSSFPLIYSMPVGLAQSVSASPTFTVTLVASINNYSSTCAFGVNPDSSINYSSKYDSLASYPGIGVYCYLLYYNPSTFENDKLSRYIVPSYGKTTWHLEVESIDQGGILTLTWSNVPASPLTLHDGITQQVYAEMNEVGNFSYRVYAGAISDFDIVYLSIPKPSIPQFTVEVGESKAIEVAIKNQPFVPYYDASVGFNISLYYNIRAKEHSEQNWTNLYSIEHVPTQSGSDYTNLTYPWELSPGSQTDFEVEAMIGYIHRAQQGNFAPYVFTGEESGWSKTQTLVISPNPSPSPRPTPEVEPFPAQIVFLASIGIALAVIGSLVYLKRRKSEKM